MAIRWAAFMIAFCFLDLSEQVDDCEPIGSEEESPSDCCTITELFPPEFKTNRDACLEKNAAFKDDQECAYQCMLESSGVLTAEKRLDQFKLWDILHAGGENSKASNAGLEECISDHATVPSLDKDDDDDDKEDDYKVKTSSPCKSGAKQFLQCYMRKVLINCPKGFLKESEGCSNLQKKAERCEDLEVELSL